MNALFVYKLSTTHSTSQSVMAPPITSKSTVCSTTCSGEYQRKGLCSTWWRHQMETFSALRTQRPVTQSFDVLICAWINRWVNNREACDLKRYRAHYDVIVMTWLVICSVRGIHRLPADFPGTVMWKAWRHCDRRWVMLTAQKIKKDQSPHEYKKIVLQ